MLLAHNYSDMLMKLDKYPVDQIPVRLACGMVRPKLMKRPNLQNEIEINYLPKCSITYKIHNCRFKVKKGSTVTFWSLMPHHIVGFNKDCAYYAINIPVSILYEWKLPQSFLDNLFKGEVQTVTKLEEEGIATNRFKRWAHLLEQGDIAQYMDCLSEICNYLKRVAYRSLSQQPCMNKVDSSLINMGETMAMFIATNFTEPIKVSDVAREVGIHSDYANSIFKKAFRTTISNYIIDQRVLYAQRKLANTNDSITSLAFQSGFNSICRFNAAFKKRNNVTPREYRKNHLTSKGCGILSY